MNDILETHPKEQLLPKYSKDPLKIFLRNPFRLSIGRAFDKVEGDK